GLGVGEFLGALGEADEVGHGVGRFGLEETGGEVAQTGGKVRVNAGLNRVGHNVSLAFGVGSAAPFGSPLWLVLCPPATSSFWALAVQGSPPPSTAPAPACPRSSSRAARAADS